MTTRTAADESPDYMPDDPDVDRACALEAISEAKERERYYRVLRMKAHRAIAALNEAMAEINSKAENYTTGSPDFLGTLVCCIQDAHASMNIVEEFYVKEVGTTVKPRQK